jgi:sulfur-oxidizing protein SoxZ
MNDNTIKIRATLAASETTVRVLMPHPMESGSRKDASGLRIPAHHITHVSVSHNDRLVLQAQFGPSVSRDPLITFKFSGGKQGDTIALVWTDNKGVTRTAQAQVA